MAETPGKDPFDGVIIDEKTLEVTLFPTVPAPEEIEVTEEEEELPEGQSEAQQ